MNYETIAILGALIVLFALRTSKTKKRPKTSGFIENFMFLVGLALALVGVLLLRKLQ